jgi:hypothetical protein
VGEHRVLTTGQIAALGFGSIITARHRLTALTEVGALRRFRPHLPVGSAPWHYLLGPIGAVLLGAEDGDDRKWQRAVRADRQLALERSQRLTHITGTNWFFASLIRHARQARDGELAATWLADTAIHDWMWQRSSLSDREHPSPDGVGGWTENGHETEFMLEYDTGTEHLPQLTAKLPGYTTLAHKTADAGNLCPLLLFCFPAPRREQAARRAFSATTDAAALRIATTATNPEETSPAGPVWLPLSPRGADSGGRVALSALDAALPDPWAQPRAQAERARQEAIQAREAMRGHWSTYLPDPAVPPGTTNGLTA